MEWQSIETAPRDGTAILVTGGIWVGDVNGDADYEIAHVHWCEGNWEVLNTEYYMVVIESPTHWMPLPQPSEAER